MTRTLRPLAGFAASLLLPLLGCEGPLFTPQWELDRLHLLAVQAEPPEIAPAGANGEVPDRARLTSLVVDPAHLETPGRLSTVIYLACTARPGDLETPPCAAFEALRDPASLAEGSETGECSDSSETSEETSGEDTSEPSELGTGVLGGVAFLGVEECDADGCRPARLALDPAHPDWVLELPPPPYIAPKELDFAALPEGSPARKLGLRVTIMALVLDAAPAELLPEEEDPCGPFAGITKQIARLMNERENVTASKVLTIRGPDAIDPPNRNPRIEGIVLRGTAVPPRTLGAEGIALSPGQPRIEGAFVPVDELLQPYTRVDSKGEVLGERREKWTTSWFTAHGALNRARTHGFDEAVTWTPPTAGAAPVPEKARLYAVVRDLRGGVTWAALEVETRR